MVTEMLEMIKEMEFLAEKAGVPINRLDITQDAIKFKYDTISDGHRWVFMIYKGEWLGASRARALCTEDIWNSMEMFEEDFKNHREVKILTKALLELKKALCSRLRPDLFKKGKRNVWLKKIQRNSKAKEKAKSRKKKE